jgi:hypothetical protein
MSLIVFIKRFLLLFNIMTLITILSYLYAFNLRTNDIESVNFPVTSKQPSLKSRTYKKSTIPKQKFQSLSSGSNVYTTFVNDTILYQKFNSSLKLFYEIGNSTEPNVEYYGDEDSTKLTSTRITTTTTSTTTVTTSKFCEINFIVLEFFIIIKK